MVHHLVRAGHRPGQGRVHIGGGDRHSREAISLARHRHRRALLRNGRLRERIHAHATTAASCCWCGFSAPPLRHHKSELLQPPPQRRARVSSCRWKPLPPRGIATTPF